MSAAVVAGVSLILAAVGVIAVVVLFVRHIDADHRRYIRHLKEGKYP